MFIEAKIDQLEEILDFSWRLQSMKESASTPIYQNRNDLRDTMTRYIKHQDDKVLVFYIENEMKAVVNLAVEPENRYLQAGAYVSSNHHEVYSEFFAYIKEIYPKYEIHFGFPKENVNSIRAMHDFKAELVASSLITRLYRRDFHVKTADIAVYELDDARFEEFAAFHDRNHPDMYWNSERIAEKRDRWKIYVSYHENRLVASAQYAIWNEGEAEIYALTADESVGNIQFVSELLSESALRIFEWGKENILFFIEEQELLEKQAALSVGFQITGNSQSFKLVL